MKNILAVCAFLLASLTASAATYVYTGAPYNTVNNFAICGTGSCANFTTAMQVNGSFTTLAPLAPNLPAADITPLLTSFTFSDGVTTYASTNPNVRVYMFIIETDAAGTPSGSILLERWQAGAAPHALGDRFDYFQVIPGSSQAFRNQPCGGLGVSPAGTPDTCLSAVGDGSSSAASGPPGAFAPALPPVLTAIPTLAEWSLVLLALLTGGAGIVGLRRRQRAV